MALQELTSRDAVLAAIAECKALGVLNFWKKYGSGKAFNYVISFEGERYPSRAIVQAAFNIQHPERTPLTNSAFDSGESEVKAAMERLGFTMEVVQDEEAQRGRELPMLEVDRVYSWDELGSLFGCSPDYFNRVGGMASRPAMGALLLITHLDSASFDYGNYWDGGELIYTGRGQTGNQNLEGQNGQLARNEATNFVFKYDSPRHLHFLGVARAKQYWWAKGLDRDGVERRIIRFRLSFEEPRGGELQSTAARADPVRLHHRPNLTPRPFDETRPPAPFVQREEREPPEETLARQEKAAHGHHDLLAALNRALITSGWNIIEEMRGAIDLWARRPGDGQRVIFEAKTLGDGTEVHQTRSALSQLLEYRHFLGAPDDLLCLVTNAPISDVRERFLRTQGVAVLVHDGATFQAAGPLALEVLGALVQKK